MSNSLIPSGPNQKDIAEMARLRAIMNGTNVPAVQEPVQAHYAGGSAGTQRSRMNESYNHVPPPAYAPSFGTSREEVDAMKTLLEKMNQLSGEEPAPAPARQPLVETTNFSNQMNSSGPYSVLSIIKESDGKEVARYSVVDANRQDVLSDLVIKEAATAIMKLLNKGHSLSSQKVQEVVELEESFNRHRLQTAQNKSRYNRAVQLGETEAAKVFKERFGTSRANALAAQDDIKSLNESIR